MNINQLVKKHDFKFSKKYGQNFIGDENLLASIATDARITEDDVVIEIGPGAGTLTREIAKRAKKVIAYEIDRSLAPILDETLLGYDNVELIFGDFSKLKPDEIDQLAGGPFKVVANLPYYITTPLLFQVLDCKNMQSATVMVQKEVAERICAKENTADYGVLSVSVQLKSKPEITRIVNRNCFTPAPNVDSAIVRIEIAPKEGIENEALLKNLVRSAFAMRRKTLVNNLIGGMGLSRADSEDLLQEMGLPVTVRGETLSVDQFIELAKIIAKKR